MKKKEGQFIAMHRFPISPVCLLTLWAVALYAGAMPASASGAAYRLNELYRIALERAERIQISREDLAIAELTREKALSVLRPRFSAVTSYKDYTEEENLAGALVQPTWESAYGVTVGQSFTLNGRELTALRIAETGIEKNRFDLDAVREGYLLAVATAFFDVAKAQKAVEIADANVRRLETHRSAVDRKLRLAEVPKTERFRTDAELAKATADRIEAENGQHLALAGLARLTGIEAEYDILEETGIADDLSAAGLDDLKAAALNARAEMKSLRLAEQIAGDRVKYSKGAFWPTVGIEGGWLQFGRSPKPALDESIYLGVAFDFKFYDGGLRRAEVREARSRQRQASHAASDTARAIAVEVEEAWRQLVTQRGIIASLASQRRYAEENYTAVRRLFDHGMANSVDVMDANTLLVTAQRQLTDARYTLRVARLKLRRAGGTFLAHVEQQLAGLDPGPGGDTMPSVDATGPFARQQE
jgi:outer membrane protein